MKIPHIVLAASSALLLLTAHAGETEIRKNLAAALPQLAKIDEVRQSPMPGLWEARVGSQVFYTDADGKYLIQGNLLDVKGKRNLTEERVEKLSAVDFDKLPTADAFKIVRGNGQRQLAVFEDPNCGYCKKFERDMAKVDNVTIHLYLYPVLGADSIKKAKYIWCADDKGKVWEDWMVKSTPIPEKTCDTAALDRNIEFGRKHNITGTPTLIFADGARVPGAIPVAEVEKKFTSIK